MKILEYFNYVFTTNIDHIKQNKPSLVAKDLYELYEVPYDVTYKILLGRGIFKWLAIRRKLIKLKNVWKERITSLQNKLKDKKEECKKTDRNDYKKICSIVHEIGKIQGALGTYMLVREEVRTLCHSSRRQCPDFDKNANKFLEMNLLLDDKQMYFSF